MSDSRQISGAHLFAVHNGNPTFVTDFDLLSLRFSGGKSFDEIAAIAHLSSREVRLRISRAVESIRKDENLRREFGLS